MLFSRTIRRKMVLGLAFVMAMLLTLAAIGVSGLTSYSVLVDDLDHRLHDLPSRAELFSTVFSLYEPLKNARAARNQAGFSDEWHQDAFKRRLAKVRKKVQETWAKFDNQPEAKTDSILNTFNTGLFGNLDSKLNQLDKLVPGMVEEDPVALQRNLEKMGHLIHEMQVDASSMNDPADDLELMLQNAGRVYESRLRMIGLASLFVVILLVALIRYVYVGIFRPLKQLHQGVSRVAQGKYDYRVVMDTRDEISELAESFNEMTARFREVKQNLDQQVRERSKQLVRSERLAGIGFLAAGVAHEINNPLSALSMAAESLETRIRDLPLEDDNNDHALWKQYLGMIQDEAFRCQQITRKLLDFARGQDEARSKNDLTAIVTEVIQLVSAMSKYRDRNIIFDRDEPCWIEINGPEIKQVILNLVSNALESMDSGGTLKVNINTQTDDVSVVCIDDGCGMSAETVENLFEPFYTKRRDGKGTGLGMCISHRIVSDHGGTIEVASEGLGCGSTVTVQLPRRMVATGTAA